MTDILEPTNRLRSKPGWWDFVVAAQLEDAKRSLIDDPLRWADDGGEWRDIPLEDGEG